MVSRVAITATVLLALVGGACAGDPPANERIRTAIKGGQAFLRAVYKPGGPGPGWVRDAAPGFGVAGVGGSGSSGVGSVALAGLALIESGVPANDEAVANITRFCRDAALSTYATYDISLLIMYFDRLGRDRPLIQFLTLRLLTGQSSDGSWSYSCAGLQLDPVQERQLRATLLADSRLTTPERAKPKDKPKPREDLDGGPKPKKDPPPIKVPDEPKEESKEPKRPSLHPSLRDFARQIAGAGGFGIGSGDHSNTQFATVGLWCGRRHGVPVDEALGRIDKHFRNCQSPDGGWAYTPGTGFGGASPAMTCAGLMGLALGFGAKNLKEGNDQEPRLEDPEALNKDRQVTAGLKYVGDFIAAAGQQRAPIGGGFQANDLSNNLYFMWSLERVGMVYGLTSIGKVDWYDWGSNILIGTQQRDGSWRSDGFHSGSTDNATSFALLFLCRANLTADLTNSLKGKMKDPGTARLTSGKDLGKMLEGAGKGSNGTKKDSGARPRTDTIAPKSTDPGDKLTDALMAAGPGEREVLIARYRDSKGGEYTDALARAAAKTTGEKQTQVRDALAQRLGRMTPNTLIDYMKDEDRELRRAATLAAGSKGKDRLRELAEALIARTADGDAAVAQGARSALKALTDQDFGPEAGASAADRGKAMLAWRSWWMGQK